MNTRFAGGQTSAAELQFTQRCLETLKIVVRSTHQEAMKAASACHRQEDIYRRTRRDSEALEILREEQLEQFRICESRRDQQHLDEIHSLMKLSKTGQALPTNPAELAQPVYFPRDETFP